MCDTNPEQDVKQAAVSDVHFRRFDLAFVEILVPRLKLPRDQQTCEEVQIPPHRRFATAALGKSNMGEFFATESMH